MNEIITLESIKDRVRDRIRAVLADALPDETWV